MTFDLCEGFMNRAHTIPFSEESAISFKEGWQLRSLAWLTLFLFPILLFSFACGASGRLAAQTPHPGGETIVKLRNPFLIRTGHPVASWFMAALRPGNFALDRDVPPIEIGFDWR